MASVPRQAKGGSMPNQDFEATPTLGSGGKVVWKLCHITPDPDVCGSSKATYPDITLGRGTGKHTIEFVITNDNTGKGIKFANTDPLWIKKGSQPTGPSGDPQIEPPTGNGTTKLTFVDKNDKPDKADPAPYVLKYQLNFVDKDNKTVTSIDPDIKNGGTTSTENSQMAVLLARGR